MNADRARHARESTCYCLGSDRRRGMRLIGVGVTVLLVATGFAIGCGSDSSDGDSTGGKSGSGGKGGSGGTGATAASGGAGGTGATAASGGVAGGGNVSGAGGAAGGGNVAGVGGGGTGGGGPCNITTCQGKTYACGNCLDDDGDGKIDMEDPDCLGPCHNAENTYYGS